MKVFFHIADADGWMCRAIAHSYFGKNAEYIPWNYHYDHRELLEMVKAGENVMMMDLSLPVKEMTELAILCNLTWIDHHAKAIENMTEAGVVDLLDGHLLQDGISACELAWRFFYPDDPMPIVVEALGVYDTHRVDESWDVAIIPTQLYFSTNLINTREYEDALMAGSLEPYINKGLDMLDFERSQMQRFIRCGEFKKIRGHEFYCINATFNPGRMLEAVRTELGDVDKLCLYYWTGTTWKYSLRSEFESVVDAAEYYGGGGHEKACGFVCEEIIWKNTNVTNLS